MEILKKLFMYICTKKTKNDSEMMMFILGSRFKLKSYIVLYSNCLLGTTQLLCNRTYSNIKIHTETTYYKLNEAIRPAISRKDMV